MRLKLKHTDLLYLNELSIRYNRLVFRHKREINVRLIFSFNAEAASEHRKHRRLEQQNL